MNTMITKLALSAALVASMSAPVLAQRADWSQQGDYYAPSRTTVQQVSPRELNEFRHGDYYTPSNTVVRQAPPQEFNAFRRGDFYEPNAN